MASSSPIPRSLSELSSSPSPPCSPTGVCSLSTHPFLLSQSVSDEEVGELSDEQRDRLFQATSEEKSELSRLSQVLASSLSHNKERRLHELFQTRKLIVVGIENFMTVCFLLLSLLLYSPSQRLGHPTPPSTSTSRSLVSLLNGSSISPVLPRSISDALKHLKQVVAGRDALEPALSPEEPEKGGLGFDFAPRPDNKRKLDQTENQPEKPFQFSPSVSTPSAVDGGPRFRFSDTLARPPIGVDEVPVPPLQKKKKQQHDERYVDTLWSPML